MDAIPRQLARFREVWFGPWVSNGIVPPFWFNARRSKNRGIVKEMLSETLPSLEGVLRKRKTIIFSASAHNTNARYAEIAVTRPVVSTEKQSPTLPVEEAASIGAQDGNLALIEDSRVDSCVYGTNQRTNLLAAIYLDQIPRTADAAGVKYAHFKGDTSRSHCDRVARSIAQIAADSMQLDHDICTCAEWCFLTLIFRHTRNLTDMDTSLLMLRDQRVSSWSRPQDQDLVKRFEQETERAITQVKAEAYITAALESDVPQLLHTSDGGDTSGLKCSEDYELPLEVLDTRCLDLAKHDPQCFISGFPSSIAGHPTTSALSQVLEDMNIGQRHCLLLSLSGGVDSMAHAAMLSHLRGKFGYKLAAIHIRHPNRSDSPDEEGWVRLSADRLGVTLYGYEVKLQRPHGDYFGGISRERYEAATKDIRFRMYQLALESEMKHSSVDQGLVMIGHHQDDIDENRLTELGKGNSVNIDGMRTDMFYKGVRVVRPLLHLRKEAMFSLADSALLPYMVDSTPRWSRRGWIRWVLDSTEPRTRAQLLAQLAELGLLSANLGNLLTKGNNDTVVKVGEVNAPVVGGESHRMKIGLIIPAGGVDGMEQLTTAALPHINSIQTLSESVATIWNTTVAELSQMRRNDSTSVSETLNDDEPGTCPIQPIVTSRLAGGAISPASSVFERLIKSSLRNPDILPLLEGRQVSARTMYHLFEATSKMASGTRNPVPATCQLNVAAGSLWIPSIGGLVIFHSNYLEEIGGNTRLKREFASICVDSVYL